MRLVVILVGLLAAPAAAQTFPPLSGRVVDQANIIPDDREAAMTLQLEQLQRATSRQLVVATIADLEGYEIVDYGYRLGRHWGIGQSEANNGVILLVAPNQRRVRIEVGYGLEGILTDALSSRIINEQIVPRFRANDYAGGIEVGTAALVSQLAAPPEAAEQRAIEAERARDSADARGDDGGGGALEWILIVVVISTVGFSVIGGVLGGLGVGSGRRYRRGRVSPWGRDYDRGGDSGLGWFIAGAVLDAALRGGSSGGSSWSGGGGSSWGGGGGGGFSGGGGSFGGGGASGSW
ncbi:TPM domain-containing protein [Sphingosinicella sp.]|uniref:TPM domain-containing protein n=1 Tax=Sphingosinicella sp. TaxID=1917971 RepID=UPI0040378B23